MAKMVINGLSEIMDQLSRFETSDIADEMLDVQADILLEAEKQTASSMLTGPYAQGAVAASISKGRKKKKDENQYVELIFKGTQHGERLAAIAYINEYGKTNQPARPFVSTAIEQSADLAVEKSAEIIDKYIK